MLLLGEDCHWMVPVLPLSVRTVLLVPLHTEAVPETVPPTEAVLTVTVTGVRVAEGQVVDVHEIIIWPLPVLEPGVFK